MKDANLTEMFCEVLGGLGLAVLIVPIFDLANVYRMNDLFAAVLARLDWAVLGSILLLAYLAGAIVDALGLAVEELFLGKLITADHLTDEELKKFWGSAQGHVVEYRDRQWAWYSCYRNLFILFLPSSILWTWISIRNCRWYIGLVVLAAFVVVETCFVVTMKALVSIYFRVTRSIRKSGGADEITVSAPSRRVDLVRSRIKARRKGAEHMKIVGWRVAHPVNLFIGIHLHERVAHPAIFWRGGAFRLQCQQSAVHKYK